MIKSLINRIKQVLTIKDKTDELKTLFTTQLLLTGKLFEKINRENKAACKLSDFEFKVFSQFGDDGIINFLINNLDLPSKNFIEFGVENYTESNTRFLLLNNNWSGLVIDGTQSNIDYIKRDPISRRFDLRSVCEFITAENVNVIFETNGYVGDVGLLSIDIDGNDYWVWKAINIIKPAIVVCEYNSIWGFDKPFTVPYDPKFYRTNFHYSNLSYGSSLLSLCDLASEKGYSFIGCNSQGNNAYFVLNEKLNDSIEVLKPEIGYVESKFSESKNSSGSYSFLKGLNRLNLLKGTPIYNTRDKKIEII
jgi:hypothetical protein